METPNTTVAFDFSTAREAWVAKGRPADPTDAYWTSVLASEQATWSAWGAPLNNGGPRTFVEPLITLR